MHSSVNCGQCGVTFTPYEAADYISLRAAVPTGLVRLISSEDVQLRTFCRGHAVLLVLWLLAPNPLFNAEQMQHHCDSEENSSEEKQDLLSCLESQSPEGCGPVYASNNVTQGSSQACTYKL